MRTEGHYGVCGELLLRKYDGIHRLEDRQTSSPSLTLSQQLMITRISKQKDSCKDWLLIKLCWSNRHNNL